MTWRGSAWSTCHWRRVHTSPSPGYGTRSAYSRPSGRWRHGPWGRVEWMKTSGGRACGRPIAGDRPLEARGRVVRGEPGEHVGHELVAAADVAGRRRRRRSPPTPRRPAAARRAGPRAAAGAAPRSRGRRAGRPAAPPVARRGFAHSRSGHRSVIGSTTVSSWLRRKRVKRLRGWSRVVGMEPRSGRSPVSCAGTASAVRSSTVVALRYQVASRAKRARFGNSAASTVPSPASIVVSGSSSMTTCTIGVEERAGPATEPTASPGSTSSRTGEPSRKSSTTTTGAGESMVRKERAGAARAYSTAAAAPTAAATANGERPTRPSARPSGGSTSAATSSPTSASSAARPSAGRSRPSAHTSAAAGQRRHERVAEREQEDVGAGAVPRHEELRVAPEQVEERLGEARAPTARPRCSAARQKPTAARGAPGGRAHARGRAS